MSTLFNKIPFLRITLAFAIGIVLSSVMQFPKIITVSLAILCLLLIFFLHKSYSYKKEVYFGIFTFILFMSLGAYRYVQYNPDSFEVSEGIKIVQLLENPQEKTNSFKILAKLQSTIKREKLIQSDELALLYFQKTEDVKYLKTGDQILVKKKFQLIRNSGNPYEFDYKGYLANKKIYKQAYLKPGEWKSISSNKKGIRIVAEQVRNKLLAIYHKQQMGERETEILSALTLGYKQNLDQETKQTFSSAGVIHVLAVSGLHVGILYMVVQYCFGFLRRQKTGRVVYVILLLVVLWSYAFISGLSPSVMRAATMFSLVCIATNINRRANIYNTVATSALLLLLINPNNLFEVGFQLSYAAVFGIVFLQPRLYSLFSVKNKIARFFWSLLTVSLAAQIATFPLTAFYFNQFPTYFWIANLFIIPAVTVLIPLGLFLLVFPFVPALPALISVLINWLIAISYKFLSLIEMLPYSVVPISVSAFELVILILAIAFLFSFLQTLKANQLKISFALGILLFFSITLSLQMQKTRQEFMVFNVSNNTCVMLTNGTKSSIISEKPILKKDFLYREINNIVVKKRLNTPEFVLTTDTFENDYLLLKNKLLLFNNSLFSFDANKTNKQIEPDYIIDTGYLNWQKKQTAEATQIITDHSPYSKFTSTQKMHFLNKSGAYQKHW